MSTAVKKVALRGMAKRLKASQPLPQGTVPDEAAVFGFAAHPQGEPEHLNYSINVNGTVITPEGFGNKTRRALLQNIQAISCGVA